MMSEADFLKASTAIYITFNRSFDDVNYTGSNDTTVPVTSDEIDLLNRTLTEVVFIEICLCVVIATTISGNLLVCITIATDRKLRNTTNYFILSLAVTDFLLGCLVLPLSAFGAVETRWPLGSIVCNIYVSSDVTLCTVSILTLFAISLDRYFAITHPLRYHQTMRCRIVWKINAFIWILSSFIGFIPIHLGWNTVDGSVQNFRSPGACAFELNVVYVMVIAIGTYFLPLVIMCGVYMKILRISREQVKVINRLHRPASNSLPMVNSSLFSINDIVDGSFAPAPFLIVSGKPTFQLPVLTTDDDPAFVLVTEKKRRERRALEKARERKLVSDTKATLTLGSVVVAFGVCWIPYFVLFVCKPFLENPVNVHLDLLALWLGYVNSAINPFLYGFYNSSFRNGFRRVLCRRCPCFRGLSPRGQADKANGKPSRAGVQSDTSDRDIYKQVDLSEK